MSPPSTDLSDDNDLAARLEGASNVLLEAPSAAAVADAACIDLLTVTPPADATVLHIGLTRSPDDFLEVWQRHADDLPAATGIVTTGDAARGAAARPASARQTATTLTLATVGDPGDLTGLGIEITKSVQRWREADPDTSLYVCFHSVTILLQYVDLRRAFRFLHILTRQLRTAGAVAHYHLDPDAHDQQTRSTLRTLFDLVVAVDAEGSVDIQR